MRVGGGQVSPRDVVAACLPDPATLGDRMHGLTCAGTWVTGTGKDGAPREVYLHHVVDNAWSMAEYGSQAVVWQTAVNPVVALELIDSGAWSGAGVLGPEALPAEPFLDLLTDYGSPWACEERTPAGKSMYLNCTVTIHPESGVNRGLRTCRTSSAAGGRTRSAKAGPTW